MVAVVDGKLKIPGKGLAGRALVGNVDTEDMRAPLRCRSAEPTISGREFDEDRFGTRLGKVRTEEAQLRLDVAPRSLRCITTGETRMVGNALEELGVEGFEQFGALFPGGGAEPRGEFLFYFVVVAELVRGSGGRWHGAREARDGRVAREEGRGRRG